MSIPSHKHLAEQMAENFADIVFEKMPIPACSDTYDKCLVVARAILHSLNLEQLLADKARIDCIRDILGDTRQASDSDITMYQDDATHDYFVVINAKTSPQHFFGGSIRTAIDSAIAKGGER